jgi:transposase
MEEMIINYIKSHTNGVKMTEMEETLRQSRLRLGYVASKLLQEGKIKKVENRYFPTPLLLEKEENNETFEYNKKFTIV